MKLPSRQRFRPRINNIMKNKKTNISLIGMAGSGKSTLGVLLAKSLNLAFVDTDLLIQQKYDCYLWELLNRIGNADFLEIEGDVIKELNLKNTLIATGGSAVCSKRAMEHLKETSTVVFLDVPFKEIEKRVQNIKTRGLVIEKGHTLEDTYNHRLPLYRAYADITVKTDRCTLEESVEEIIKKLKN